MTHFLPKVALALLGSLQLSSADGADKALLIIDVQKCFMPGGTLGVEAKAIIPKIEDLIGKKWNLFDYVVFSQDYHPKGHISFATSHGFKGDEPFAGFLPMMCAAGTGKEAEAACCPTQYINPATLYCKKPFPAVCSPTTYTAESSIVKGNSACETCKTTPAECTETTQAMWADHCLADGDSAILTELTNPDTDIVVRKGGNRYVDAYSAFADNTKNVKTELDDELKKRGIKELYVVGIATDYCVKETVIDGLNRKLMAGAEYKITVITDATEAVFPGGKEPAFKEMEKAGAILKTTEEVLASADRNVLVEINDQGDAVETISKYQ